LGLDRPAVEQGMRALRCSNQETRWVADLAERWQRLGPELRAALGGDVPGVPDVQLRRWAAAAGRTLAPAVLRLAAARFAAERALGLQAPEGARVRSAYRRLVRVAYRDPIALGDLAVSGADLQGAAGVPAGPRVGQILQRLLELVVEDPAANVRERLLAEARRLAAP
jgi:hypothetical protein